MKAKIFVLLFFQIGCIGDRVSSVQAGSSLQQQVSQGGTITLPAGTINIDCSDQFTIAKSTTIIGAGRDLTILHDICPNGDTILVDLTNPANVRLEGWRLSMTAAIRRYI